MSLFDPLGLLSPFLIHGRMLIQDLWRIGLDWDTEIGDMENEKWRRWIALLPSIGSLEVPRCYFGYAHPKSYESLHLHTDAEVVLAWIRSPHRNYKQFVAHRVGEILTLTEPGDWRHVGSKENLADCLTKWGKHTEPDLARNWLEARNSFLYHEEEHWPKQKKIPETSEELRAHLLLHHIVVPEGLINVERFSKWSVLVRTMALVNRFVSNCRRKMKGQPIEVLRITECQKQLLLRPIPAIIIPLRQEEYLKAEQFLWQVAQYAFYPDETKTLKNNRNEPQSSKWMSLEKNSPLYRLSPFADEFGVIRVEGRTANASYATFDARFPVILPKDHPITTLLLKDYHCRFGHANRETIVNEVRQRFHIFNLRSTVNKVMKACQRCKVTKCKPVNPRMAPLPEERLTPFLRPFSYVGVDYLGPLETSVGRRKERRYVAVFTCLVIRAVHLELAYSLSTDSCVMAVRRFIRRRGPPVEIFSDNGTNFVGASNELKEQIRSINCECANTFTDARTKWTFNPPSAPHMTRY